MHDESSEWLGVFIIGNINEVFTLCRKKKKFVRRWEGAKMFDGLVFGDI